MPSHIDKALSTTDRQSSTGTKGRPPRYGDLLTVDKVYDERESPRCPKCTWTLLSKPSSQPGIPIISVTDPDGMVRYPYDHTYYADDLEDDSSDAWD